MQDEQLVADSSRARDIVCHDNHCGFARCFQIHEKLIDLSCSDRVETAAGLVHQKYGRLQRQGSRQAHALSHASRQVERHLV